MADVVIVLVIVSVVTVDEAAMLVAEFVVVAEGSCLVAVAVASLVAASVVNDM